MREPTVLAVDADERERETTRETLVTDGDVAAIKADSVAEASDALDADRVDSVITDDELPDGTGLDAAARARELADQPGDWQPVVFETA